MIQGTVLFTTGVTLLLSQLVHPLPLSKTQEELRASLITKHSFASQRQKKEIPVPKPFIISTSLKVSSNESPSSRQPKAILTDDSLKDVPVIEGVRMPDDASDRITWRNGRVINNIFVSNDAPLPKETLVTSQMLTQKNRREGRVLESLPGLPEPLNIEGRDYTYKAGQVGNGRPVYYVVEEDLHSDKGPYTFEPADSASSAASTAIDFPIGDITQSGIAPANNDDFIIKDHTYSLCPGCPTFSIPVPIPKASYTPNFINGEKGTKPKATSLSEPVYQYARNESFLEKIGDRIIATVQDLQNTVLEATAKGQKFFNLGEEEPSEIAEKISKAVKNVEPQYKYAAAGMAAVAAFGSLAYYAVTSHEAQSPSTGRSFGASDQLNDVLAIIDSIKDKYDDPPKCIDEQKCIILMEHIDQSPELTYAKKYYEFRYQIKDTDLCHLLRCVEETPTTEAPEESKASSRPKIIT